MKQFKTILLIITFGLCVQLLYGITIDGRYEKPVNIKKGGKETSLPTKGLIDIPVSATLQNNVLSVTYDESFANLTVTITKNGLQIISETVNVQPSQIYCYYLSTYGSDSYTITFTTSSGDYYYGEFILQ